jgi:hypothetical protein
MGPITWLLSLINGLTLELVFWSVFSVLCLAFLFWAGLKFVLPPVWRWNERRLQTRYHYHSERDVPNLRITVFEAAVCSAVALFATLPTANAVVHDIAVSSAVDGYHEYLNGNLITATSQEYTCERDGICEHTYQCDPYEVWESYEDTETKTRTVTKTDSKGQSYTTTETYTVTVTKWHWVTHYHSCPFATSEYSYWLKDSLGQDFTIASHIFAANAARWRGDQGLPDVPQGVPPQWADAKAAIDRGDNPPTVKLHDYTNYMLAAQDTILRQFSNKINQYRDAGLLPSDKQLAVSVHGVSTADKVVFMKLNVDGSVNSAWQDAVNHLNSQLGSELQGDLHVVVVPADEVDNSTDYTNALLAAWQSRQLDKDGLAKNAILLVLGVSKDQSKVVWSQAKTGIPEGNGSMLTALSNDLTGKAFEPVSLIGRPQAHMDGDKVAFTPSKGEVERIVLHDYPFLRPCMMCKDAGDHGQGYVYLKDSALLPGWVSSAVVTSVIVVGLVAFVIMMFIDFDTIAASWLRRGLEKFQSLRNRRSEFES